jgi:hypothetical protein
LALRQDAEQDTPENALVRFHSRISDAELARHHREASEMIDGDDELTGMDDRLDRLLRTRPHARIICTTHGASGSQQKAPAAQHLMPSRTIRADGGSLMALIVKVGGVNV